MYFFMEHRGIEEKVNQAPKRRVARSFEDTARSLHAVAAPAVRGTVKTELSLSNNTILVFSFEAKKKIKTMLKLLWPLVKLSFIILGLI